MADGLRIAIVDNFPIFRDGVVQALRRDKGFVVVGESTTAEDAKRFVSKECRPPVE